MKKCLILSIFIIFYSFSVIAQINDNKIRLSVLKKGIIGHTFVFGKWTKDGNTETHLKYLGSVTTIKKETYKIMTSAWCWGLSYRATSVVLIYSKQNKFIGSYHVGSVVDLPNQLKNGKLLFDNNDNPSCDKMATTIIDLNHGLPKQLFIKCKGAYGDLYSFSSD